MEMRKLISSKHLMCIGVVLSLIPITVSNVGSGCDFRSDKESCNPPYNHRKSRTAFNIEDEETDFTISGVCPLFAENKTDLELLGSCSSNGGGMSQPMVPADMRSSRCFCDSLCHIYHDCCIDLVEDSHELDISEWSCRKLTQVAPPINIYMFQRCPTEFTSETVRTLCEHEAVDLQKTGKHFNYLQNIPVHALATGIIYRNVYCAMCNNDLQLTTWRTHVHCYGSRKPPNLSRSIDVVDFTKNASYIPKKDLWYVYEGNKRKSCQLIVEELSAWESLLRYGVRLCKIAIATCPPGTSPSISYKCLSYTSYVYSADVFGRLKSTYRNFHCALCNGVLLNQTVCSDPSYPLYMSGNKTYDKPWLPLLFDFNFDGQGDNQVGDSPPCRLEDGQIWDPLLKSCLNVTCGRSYREYRGKCIPIIVKGNATESSALGSCRKIILSQDLFIITENNSVYVNYSEKTYSEGEYEVYEADGGVVKKILICEYEKILVFDPGQAWLSEIMLGLSVTCLILHEMVYGLIPSLRNRPGKVLMSLSSGLICGHLFLLMGPHCSKTFWLCYTNAVFTFYGYLSAFFWMNVMAFDIYRTFSSSGTRTPNKAIFAKYSCYAWLCSLVLVVSAIVTDYGSPDSLYSPKFGSEVCWFNQKRGLLIFFAVPIALLLVANLLLFLATARNIRNVSKQTKLVKNFSDKLRYYLYVKLAVVLGLTWLFGFLAASLKLKALWYPFIILNGLQGVLIFSFFTLKRKVLNMLIVKLRLRSEKYTLGKIHGTKKPFYNSLSNLTTLQTSLTSTIAPVACGSPDMLKAVRPLNEYDSTSTKL